MHPAICAGPWWWTKLSPPSASKAAATTYSCSAVRGAVGSCVAAGRRGRVSRQGTWGSSCAGHAATGPMVTAATADASAVRSVGPVLPESRGISGEVPAGLPSRPPLRSSCSQVRHRSHRRLPTAVPWWRCRAGGPAVAPPGPAPAGGRAGLAVGSFARPGAPGACGTGPVGGVPGLPRGWKRSWCRYQWPSAADGLRSVSHCSTTPPGCAASTRRCNPRRPRRLDVPAGGMCACG